MTESRSDSRKRETRREIILVKGKKKFDLLEKKRACRDREFFEIVDEDLQVSRCVTRAFRGIISSSCIQVFGSRCVIVFEMGSIRVNGIFVVSFQDIGERLLNVGGQNKIFGNVRISGNSRRIFKKFFVLRRR